jgi:hypothetical protein
MSTTASRIQHNVGGIGRRHHRAGLIFEILYLCHLHRPHPAWRQGERTAVQLPTSFKLVVNLKAAKAIGLNDPAELLLRADQAIE